MVERLLQSDLSVDEWSKNNSISRATMYNWLSELAGTEPELFGGRRNIADTEKRNWLQITRKNIAEASALTVRKSDDVLVVGSDNDAIPESSIVDDTALPPSSIQVAIKGAHVAIPAGALQADIESVLRVVASL
jgi:thiamine pyrophosphate-dependent acetolactate synthase large subunit-like protein